MKLLISLLSVTFGVIVILLIKYNYTLYKKIDEKVYTLGCNVFIIFIDYVLILLSYLVQDILPINGALPLVAIFLCNIISSFLISHTASNFDESSYKTLILAFILSCAVISYMASDIKNFEIFFVYFCGFIISINLYDLKIKERFMKMIREKRMRTYINNIVLFICAFAIFIISFCAFDRNPSLESNMNEYFFYVVGPFIAIILLYIMFDKHKKKYTKTK